MGSQTKIHELVLQAISKVDLLLASELAIQKFILDELIKNEYENYKSNYTQSFPRLKNHTPANPDLVIKKNDEISIIEVKLLPDKSRNSRRFERAFIDCAYLKNEIIKNGVRGYFIIIDLENTNYFKDKKFVELTEDQLNLKLSVIINWEKLSENASVVVFITEICCL